MHKTYKNKTEVYLQSNIIKLIKNQLYICQCPIFPLYLQLNGIAFAQQTNIKQLCYRAKSMVAIENR